MNSQHHNSILSPYNCVLEVFIIIYLLYQMIIALFSYYMYTYVNKN